LSCKKKIVGNLKCFSLADVPKQSLGTRGKS
jgi:hypothetical protein